MTAAYERVKAWRIANPGRRNATAKKHRDENLEESRAREAAYRDAHRAETQKRQGEWAAAHPERNAEAVRRYRATGGAAAASRRYHAADPKRHAERVRRYRDAHPGFMSAAAERRRARKALLPATLTVAEWQAILEAYGHCCAYCGRRDAPLTQDHVIPVTRGGGTTAENIVPACQPCNSRKGTKIWEPKRWG